MMYMAHWIWLTDEDIWANCPEDKFCYFFTQIYKDIIGLLQQIPKKWYALVQKN